MEKDDKMKNDEPPPLGILGIVRTIYCPGASLTSKPVPALVEVRQMYLPSGITETPPGYVMATKSERYVACPRLALYENPIEPGSEIARCFEGKHYNPYDERQFRKTRECPYFRPKGYKGVMLEELIERQKMMDRRRREQEQQEADEQRKKQQEEERREEIKSRVHPNGVINYVMKGAFPTYYRILSCEKKEQEELEKTGISPGWT